MIGRVSLLFRDTFDGPVQNRGIEELGTPFQTDNLRLQMPLVSVKPEHWSTKFLLDLMTQTVTFPERLKAGVSNDWKLGHKTGTSNTWKGVTAATNDVGILTGPTRQKIAIVVFIADNFSLSVTQKWWAACGSDHRHLSRLRPIDGQP